MSTCGTAASRRRCRVSMGSKKTGGARPERSGGVEELYRRLGGGVSGQRRAGGRSPSPAMSAERLLRADLHTHTHFSKDSIASPEALVEACRRKGISCLAVTDHNSIQGGLA